MQRKGEKMKSLGFLSLVLVAGCAASSPPGPAPLSIEFGQDVYLTDDYLKGTPGSRCGPPRYAPGGTEVRAPLPDGSWFRLFALRSRGGEVGTVILERGWEGSEGHMEIRLDRAEGIVRLKDPGRDRAWGIHSARADWMRAIGSRALSLDCAATG